MRFPVTILLLAMTLCGCRGSGSISRDFDEWLFESIGGTVFTTPGRVSHKEILLGAGSLIGRDVIIEGTIVDQSRHSTHLTLSDDSARILVVLTDLAARQPHWDKDLPPGPSLSKPIRILGTVQTGRKGLPYVSARSFRFANDRS